MSELVIESVPLDDLVNDPQNVRLHSRRNMDAIKVSLSRFGQQKPLVVTPEGTIIAGNGTFVAARELGWTHISVARIPTSWSRDEIVAYAIADNRTSELGEWDYGVLVDSLGDLDNDLVIAAGWDEAGLQFLLDPPKKPKETPAPDNAGVKDSYEDSLRNYEESDSRSLLFDYPLDEYVKVVAQLDRAREAYNVDSNAEVILILLNRHMEAI
jgi:hypothetical protein